jgi:hypothetical protein
VVYVFDLMVGVTRSSGLVYAVLVSGAMFPSQGQQQFVFVIMRRRDILEGLEQQEARVEASRCEDAEKG